MKRILWGFLVGLMLVGCGQEATDNGVDRPKPTLGLSTSMENSAKNADNRIRKWFKYQDNFRDYKSVGSIDEYIITQRSKDMIAKSLDEHTQNLREAKSLRNSGRFAGESPRFTRFVYHTEDKVQSLNKIYNLFSFIVSHKTELSDLNFEVNEILNEFGFSVKFSYIVALRVAGYKYLSNVAYLNKSKILAVWRQKDKSITFKREGKKHFQFES